ncbi:MAG: hypothetical protein JOY90_21095 [Bradyrhizobium sp.]|uniref:hypothetical protein n=1 Tax=Bradyrhizobium sp. TaxID=376 RepID=UPI001DB0FBE8|nr:hypothetical protein [Bradyrhizobium sp.]MBV9562912.1 hypothetical protein [Bradyrhizobium sp.]
MRSQARSRERLTAIGAERCRLQTVLAAEFPDGAALANPPPRRPRKSKALLSSDEAIVLYVLADQAHGHCW